MRPRNGQILLAKLLLVRQFKITFDRGDNPRRLEITGDTRADFSSGMPFVNQLIEHMALVRQAIKEACGSTNKRRSV